MSDWSTLKDQLGLTIRPIDEWPGKETRQRQLGPFSASLKDTLKMLSLELRELRARNVVLQVALRERDLRQDGLPRSDARPSHPGLVLTFDSSRGPLRIWFDRFTQFPQNLRAVAFHLQHLRHAGLYGVGEDGQQYRGWSALGPGDGTPSDREAAARLIVEQARRSGVITVVSAVLENPGARNVVIRAAQKAAHPDTGGSHELFLQVQAAVAVLCGNGQ